MRRTREKKKLRISDEESRNRNNAVAMLYKTNANADAHADETQRKNDSDLCKRNSFPLFLTSCRRSLIQLTYSEMPSFLAYATARYMSSPCRVGVNFGAHMGVLMATSP